MLTLKKLALTISITIFTFCFFSCGTESEDVEIAETCTDGIRNQDETDIDCGGVCDPCPVQEPEITRTYFVKFKLDGVWKSYQSDGLAFCQTTDGVCWDLLSKGISIELDQPAFQNSITGMKGQNFPFKSEGNNRYAYFYWQDNGVEYSTSNVPNAQQDGTLEVTNVAEGGNFFGVNYYNVSGVFSGKVADDQGENITSISEGTFTVFFYEEE